MELLTINNVWMMICTALVFIMHLGFSTLEIGLARSKNTINILFKNVCIITGGLLLYALAGFNLMYPGDFNGFFGFAGFGLEAPIKDGALDLAYNEGYTYWTDFLFQGMFAATAATIVSGAVAERAKLETFLVFSVVLVGLVYPIAGSWHWGGGFLAEMGFYDFAGSTLVHSVGGWAALVYIAFLGPRIGKYGGDKPLEGHSIPMAAIGVFLLWLGWFGFNGGSVLSAEPGATSYTLVTTCLAAATGAVVAIITSKITSGSLDVTMALNGILAGLVGITASADSVSITASIIIGAVSGVLVVLGVLLMDKLKLDDPVGAVPVHLMNGIWGTLAVGIFREGSSVGTQLIGILSYGAFVVAISVVLVLILKATMGLRVSPKEEVEGLDIHEHKMSAYPDLLDD
ncbi:MAG: ammonium transporter [Flavobacteriales bacterium]|nr:ammonium transporter [Flavobacteriales bacterium]